MEELKVEQTEQTTCERESQMQTTETEKAEQTQTETQTVSYGKFKDANALLNAYNSLQAEFTKRCQRIKELEDNFIVADKEPSPAQTIREEQASPKTDKDEILKSYVREVLMKKQSAIVLDGVGIGVKTPVQRPTTFEQAGKLAVEILKK